ncbi:hypothetical protein FIBSPDRAFT_805963 [Athelia psychrophila]|uniref:DUF6534 domain-containing protein n=1 Tax=Athelia psychrophila TaxID=1759441 RepID=A0A167VPE2_9AGAM|nr:hypothetical protein FIBSPDRAFT_805963 [Fibularhizoctonia sp. CBS 109695]
MAKGPAEIAMGPMLIGTIFNVWLFGIMCTQVHLYFHTYKTDKRWFKCLVLFLFFADTMNAVFDLIYVYDSLIVHFGDAEYLASANWVFATDPAMTAIIATTVQMFFAWRVKVITNSKIATAVVVFTSAMSFFGGLGTAIAVGMYPIFTEFVRFEVIVIIWLVGAAVTDVIVAVVLTVHLQRHRTGFSSTDDVVNKIIKLTVQTGAVTAIVAIFDIIFFLIDNTGTHLMFNIPLSKLYTNSLMSSLNARGGWKFGGPGMDVTSGTGDIATKRTGFNVSVGKPEIFVQVESHAMVDLEDKHAGTLFPESDSEQGHEQGHGPQGWSGGDPKPNRSTMGEKMV